jgi:hypothetical protein
MDPLSVAASILAVVGALEGLMCWISKVKLIMKASEEIEAIMTEILSLSLVLQTMARRVTIYQQKYEDDIARPLDNCKRIVAEFENVLRGLFAETRVPCTTSLQPQVFRIRWMRKKRRIDELTRRLERAKATLGLELLINS